MARKGASTFGRALLGKRIISIKIISSLSSGRHDRIGSGKVVAISRNQHAEVISENETTTALSGWATTIILSDVTDE